MLGSAATSQAVTAAVSELSQEQQFDKGWNAEIPAESKAQSSAQTEATSKTESTVSQPTSQVESAPASSVATTEAASITETEAASQVVSAPVSETVNQTAQQSKTLSGIVRSKDATISKLQSELEAERVAKTQSAPASQVASQAASQATSAVASTATNEAKIDDLEDKFNEAVIDGNKAEAKKLRREINALLRADVRAEVMAEVKNANAALKTEMSSLTTTALTAKDEAQAISAVVSHTYRDYPYLNNEGETPNAQAIRFVRATAAEYSESGKSRPEALSLAVSEAIPLFNLKPAATAVTTEVSSAVTSPVDEAQLKSMAAVKTKGSPVRVNQSAAGKGTFEDGWNRPVT